MIGRARPMRVAGFLFLLLAPHRSALPIALAPPVEHVVSSTTRNALYRDNQSYLQYTLLTLLSGASKKDEQPHAKLSAPKVEDDEVVRVLDPNTVKLKRNGLVSFAAVQTPSGYNSNFQFPDCFAKSPSSKARQLLPAGSKVGVRFIIDEKKSTRGKPRAALIVTKDGTLVNSELVRLGFARPVSRGRDAVENILPGLVNELDILQRRAQDGGIGMYMSCDRQRTETIIAADDQFEPLEYTVQTKWGDDGGKQIVVQKRETKQPSNPGDTKGCSDFDYYEDALQWYETYAPWYGDVAKLDSDKDGVPCPGLPHTKDQTRYRMKVPSERQSR